MTRPHSPDADALAELAAPRDATLPNGLAVELARTVPRSRDGRLMLGGSPPRWLRFSKPAARMLEPGGFTVVRDRACLLHQLLTALRTDPETSAVPAVVVDDASTNSAAVASVARLHSATLLVHQHNRGPAAARNTGLGHASTGYVAFCDSVVRRAAVGGGFAPELRVGEDVDLCLRLHQAGWRMRYVPTSRVGHCHRGNLTLAAVRGTAQQLTRRNTRPHDRTFDPTTRLSRWATSGRDRHHERSGHGQGRMPKRDKEKGRLAA